MEQYSVVDSVSSTLLKFVVFTDSDVGILGRSCMYRDADFFSIYYQTDIELNSFCQARCDYCLFRTFAANLNTHTITAIRQLLPD